jgi:hypothetical protein
MLLTLAGTPTQFFAGWIETIRSRMINDLWYKNAIIYCLAV